MQEIPNIMEELFLAWGPAPDTGQWPEVGLSARGYQDLELGAKPRYDALLHIADFYDVSVDWLMGRTDNPHAHR